MRSVNCIVCDSTAKEVLVVQDFRDEYLDLIDATYNKNERKWVRCEGCGLIYHDPQLDEKDTEVLYENFRDESFRNEDADEYFKRIISIPNSESENFAKVEWLSSEISTYLEKKGAVLDIGSGGGVFLHTFIDRYNEWTPYGVEPTSEFADLTKRQLKCEVYTGNYRKNLFNKKFELIVCNQVLEHTIDPISFLQNINSDIKKGGYFYIEVPDASDFKELPKEHDRFLAQHLWYFSEKSLTSLLEKTGFNMVKIEKQRTIRGRNNLVALLKKEI